MNPLIKKCEEMAVKKRNAIPPNQGILQKSYSAIVYLFLYLPIIILVFLSFNSAKRSLIWKSFSFRWYVDLFSDKDLLSVAMNSLILGVLAAIFATLIGLIIAITLLRYRFAFKKLLYGSLFILIILPEIVLGSSLLLLYSLFNIKLGFWSLLLAHITLCVPFAAVTIHSKTVTFNREIIESARDLGATDWIILTKILIPLLAPAIFASMLLSFTLSLDDVITSYFVSGPEFSTLPIKIYSMVKLGIKPEINALCTILILITLGFTCLYQLAMKKSNNKK